MSNSESKTKEQCCPSTVIAYVLLDLGANIWSGVQSQVIGLMCCFTECLLVSDGDTVRPGQDEAAHWEARERHIHDPSFLLLSP
jgi:hypothetical protein